VGGQGGISGLFAQQRQRCDRLTLIAGSIGAFFSMSALDKTLVDRAYFVSPVVDMYNELPLPKQKRKNNGMR